MQSLQSMRTSEAFADNIAKVETRKAAAGKIQIEPKYDGIRLLLGHDNEGVFSAYTRNRRKDGSLHDVAEKLPQLKSAAVPEHTVYDGELITGFDSTSFKVMEIIGMTSAGAVEKQAEQEQWLRYAVFDVLRYRGKDVRHLPLTARRALIKDDEIGSSALKVPAETAATASERCDIFTRSIDEGFEGVVLKDPNSAYGANKAWTKQLRLRSFDCKVVGVKRGRGKFSNTAGSLQLAMFTIDGNLEVVGSVNCGSDGERDAWWRSEGVAKVGAIVQVTAKGWTKNGKLLHPRYGGIRVDRVSPNMVDFDKIRNNNE